MTSNFRALCARMADELDHYLQLLTDNRLKVHSLATEARAALSASEQGPTDEQIMELMPQQLREDLATVARLLAAHGTGISVGPGLYRVTLNAGIVDHCRAVLARWGRPAVEPVPMSEWREDIGNVLWWRFPIEEPPYVGSPLDTDWPGHHTHFTLLPVPQEVSQ